MKIYISDEEIRMKVRELGGKITTDYRDKKLLVIGILKGSFIFMADLIREIDLPLETDFMVVSSYRGCTESQCEPEIIKDTNRDLSGYHVLIAEDILDTGKTLTQLIKLISERNPLSLKICTLLDKFERRSSGITLKADYTGFEIEDKFVIGYGLDYEEEYRNLKHIYQI